MSKREERRERIQEQAEAWALDPLTIERLREAEERTKAVLEELRRARKMPSCCIWHDPIGAING